MITTPFGTMNILLKDGKRSKVEYLVFTSSGRSHKHPNYESFFVTKGTRKIINGEKVIDVKLGDLVVITPMTSHWMETDSKEIPLEGVLWFHQEELTLR